MESCKWLIVVVRFAMSANHLRLWSLDGDVQGLENRDMSSLCHAWLRIRVGLVEIRLSKQAHNLVRETCKVHSVHVKLADFLTLAMIGWYRASCRSVGTSRTSSAEQHTMY